MNLADIISRHAAAAPHAVAVIERGRVIDYRGFERAIWRAAAWLRAQGISPGDVVAVTLGSSTLHLVVGYALARIGAVQLGLTLREPRAVRQEMAARYGARLVIGEADEARLAGLPTLLPDVKWLEPGDDVADESLRAPGGDAPWRIVFTSGTTAAPKAVLQSHAMHIAWRDINQGAMPLAPADRFLAVVELDFFSGFRLCMDVFWAGASVVAGAALATPQDLFDTVERHDVTYLYLTPSHLHRLLASLPPDEPRLPGLRLLRTGAMSVAQSLCGEIIRRLTPGLVVAYGTNDAGSPFTAADASVLQRFPGSIGFAVPGVELEIVDDAGRALAPGATGLVRVRAAGMPQAYIDNPEASARAFRDGWYYPGDLGALSSEGAFYFKGRVDDMMNFDGIKIYPADIEAALLAHPAVLEAAAFPISDQAHQDIPVAAVVLRDASQLEALTAHCRGLLGVRAPRFIAALQALPKNAAGKVLKRELAAALAARLRS